MIEEMIKEFMKENNTNTAENMEGHNIVELTNKQDQYETPKKKGCC